MFRPKRAICTGAIFIAIATVPTIILPPVEKRTQYAGESVTTTKVNLILKEKENDKETCYRRNGSDVAYGAILCEGG